jgi:hypothetical protein
MENMYLKEPDYERQEQLWSMEPASFAVLGIS